MELNTAIEIVEYHRELVLGRREDIIHEPKILTQALDILLKEVNKSRLESVSNRRELLVAFNKEMAIRHHWFLPAGDSMINEYLSNK